MLMAGEIRRHESRLSECFERIWAACSDCGIESAKCGVPDRGHRSRVPRKYGIGSSYSMFWVAGGPVVEGRVKTTNVGHLLL